MPLPNLTRFIVALKTDPLDWLLVEDIHFGAAAAGGTRFSCLLSSASEKVLDTPKPAASVPAVPRASADVPIRTPAPSSPSTPALAAARPTPKLDASAAVSTAAKSNADWRVPGLNQASFGAWNAIGDAKLEAREGILAISSRGGRVGIASGSGDFSKYDLHIELAGSSDIEAWIGVRVEARGGSWTGYTSYIKGRDGLVSAGHGGRNFATATKAENPHEYEGGMGKVETPADQFFSLDFKVNDLDALWTQVNGKTTSGVSRNVPAQGQVALFVAAGSLRIRKIEIHDRTVRVGKAPEALQPASTRETPGPLAAVMAPKLLPMPHPAPTALAKPGAKHNYGSHQEEALLGHHWSWETVGNGPHFVIQFSEDGRVSGGWHWQWLPKTNGELIVDCFWREKEHLYLKFDKQFSEFEAYGDQGDCKVRGKRLAAIGESAEAR